jgi:hypothetical protein
MLSHACSSQQAMFSCMLKNEYCLCCLHIGNSNQSKMWYWNNALNGNLWSISHHNVSETNEAFYCSGLNQISIKWPLPVLFNYECKWTQSNQGQRTRKVQEEKGPRLSQLEEMTVYEYNKHQTDKQFTGNKKSWVSHGNQLSIPFTSFTNRYKSHYYLQEVHSYH